MFLELPTVAAQHFHWRPLTSCLRVVRDCYQSPCVASRRLSPLPTYVTPPLSLHQCPTHAIRLRSITLTREFLPSRWRTDCRRLCKRGSPCRLAQRPRHCRSDHSRPLWWRQHRHASRQAAPPSASFLLSTTATKKQQKPALSWSHGAAITRGRQRWWSGGGLQQQGEAIGTAAGAAAREV